MTAIHRYNTKLEADIAAQFLTAHNIHAVVRGAKEYAAIVTGGDYGKYEVLVKATDVEVAKYRLQQNEDAADPEQLPTPARTFLRRAVMCAFMAVFLAPILFNVVSLNNLKKYREIEPRGAKRTLMTLVVILLQLPLVIVAIILLVRERP